jgi:carbonic anhydrase/acetyltransferase-like protein (isoleucine patch superfamily)
MALLINDEGRDNKVIVSPDVAAASSGQIVLRGNGNRLHVAAGCSLIDASIELGDGSSLFVAENCRLARLEVFAARRGTVSIGAGCAFTWHSRLMLHEPATITLGRDCLIGSNTLFTVSDMHSVIDIATGRRVNAAADIVVYDHVWIGLNVVLLKGVVIGRDSVIGVNAVVTQEIPERSLAAGAPARVIRGGITWSKDLI